MRDFDRVKIEVNSKVRDLHLGKNGFSNAEIQKQVVNECKEYVEALIPRISSRVPKKVCRDDLVQQGFLGVIEANERFDVKQGVDFTKYADRFILGRIRDFFRQDDHLSRLHRDRQNRAVRIVDDFYKKNGYFPTKEELVKENEGLDHLMIRHFEKPAPLVINESHNECRDDESVRGIRFLADRSNGCDPVEVVTREDAMDYVCRDLEPDEILIIKLRVYEDYTLKEVGKVLGVSESRVCQKENEIKGKLKSRFTYDNMKELI